MNWLQTILRIPRTRGFGIQSPTDYHFLRHVIRQRLPYYAYAKLADRTDKLTKREVEILHFYFRLANYIKARCPLYIIGRECFGNITPELRRLFITAGSSKIVAQQASRIPSSINENTVCVIIVENLPTAIKACQDSGIAKVVFDMQDIAVIFCDPKRYKTIYKVNL